MGTSEVPGVAADETPPVAASPILLTPLAPGPPPMKLDTRLVRPERMPPPEVEAGLMNNGRDAV